MVAASATAGATLPPESSEEITDLARLRTDGTPTGNPGTIQLVAALETRARRASAPLDRDAPRYELGAPIGRGGMGEVIAAHDLQIGRHVAIKRLHAATPTDVQLARFLREARIQGRLEHPSIPPVYELAHDDDGRPYFAMRKLEGVTLSETLRNASSPFTRQRLLRAFVEICHAIDLAHSQRIIHRD
ncbi:MAG TPA: protein kinase, partial [Kofleriaceae bacterium]|nr:protein kinase [Kofleriaceae bacterium]